MPDETIPLDPHARADDPQYDAARDDGTHEVLPDLAYKRLAIVNVAYVGAPGGPWVLVDAGVPGMATLIKSAAEARFGKDSKPTAIVLTHGHADHVGSLMALAEKWDVPVWAHALEKPYLDGTAKYPPPDTSVGGGLMPKGAFMFSRGPFDFTQWLNILPADGTVPPLPGWRWIHTPGHTPGHVSLWRESDLTLIAGDAFVTTRQESIYAVLTQKQELHGPPMYFTQNFVQAKQSVQTLAALHPEIAITGHGRAMAGLEFQTALETLAKDFDRVGVPEDGQYVEHPTRAEDGSAYVKQ